MALNAIPAVPKCLIIIHIGSTTVSSTEIQQSRVALRASYAAASGSNRPIEATIGVGL